MNLLNEVFNYDQTEIDIINKKYWKIFVLIMFFLAPLLFLVDKNYYYEGNIMIDEDNIFLIVDKDMVNEVKNKKNILINNISSNYSINRIITDNDICYLDVNLEINILNKQNMTYRVFIRKEKMIEYFIRIIKTI